jgi:meiosis induction protein kinase IME2/SME1
MAISHEYSLRGTSQSMVALEDRFEVMKEIGDGSFGSVVLARTRTAGANVARRGTMVILANRLKTELYMLTAI